MNIKRHNDLNIPNLNIENMLMFVTCIIGTFVLIPVVEIPIMGHYFTVFNLFFVLFFVLLFINNLLQGANIRVGTTIKLFIIWLMIALASSAFGVLYFGSLPNWQFANLGYTMKLLLFFGVTILLASYKNRKKLIQVFLDFFIVGCILNIVWSILDGLSFYLLGFSLNNVVFADYIQRHNIRYDTLSLIIDHSIRASGFNSDPANLGCIVPIIFLYALIKDKKIFLLLSLLALVFSQSTTGLVGCLLSFIVYFIMRIQNNRNVKLKNVILAIFGIVAFMAFLILTGEWSLRILFGIYSKVNVFAARIFDNYIMAAASDLRTMYVMNFLPAAANRLSSLLIGTGFGTASYGYLFSEESDLYLRSTMPYDPENTYISYFFNVGLPGTVLYIIILVTILRWFGKNMESKYHSMLFAFILAVMSSHLFYHYILTAYQVLIIIMSLILIDIDKEKYYMDYQERIP